MAFSYPSALGVHVNRPLTNFAVDFSRDRNVFAPSLLFPAMTVEKMSDKYWRFDSLDAFRRTGAMDNAWPIGVNSLPNSANFGKDLAEFQCERFGRQHEVPDEFVQNADFEYHQKAVSLLVSLLSIERLVQGVAAARAGLTGTSTASATTLGGGKWDVGVAATPYMRIGIIETVRRILENSMNTVNPDNIWMVISPTTAKKWATSVEILDFVKQSPEAIAAMTSGSPLSNAATFGLPRKLHGVNVFILNTVYVTSEELAATVVKSYLISDEVLFLNVESPGLMTYNTVTGFEFEPMNVAVHALPWMRQSYIQCATNFDYVVTASASGFLVTDVDT